MNTLLHKIFQKKILGKLNAEINPNISGQLIF